MNKDLADTCLEHIQMHPLVWEFWKQMAHVKIERDKTGEQERLAALQIPVVDKNSNYSNSKMTTEQELVVKLVEILAKQNPDAEEKQQKALIKKALLTDDLILFINELKNAFNGYGKVNVESVKGAVEYAKARNEVEIRNQNLSDKQKDEMARLESERLTKVEIWILGSLAHLGLLK